MQTIHVGQTPSALAFGADGTAYVVNTGDNTVSVISPNNSYYGGAYTVSSTITVGATPTSVAAGPDGRIYTANYTDGSISIIDPTHANTVQTLGLTGVHPYGIAVTASGAIYLTDPTANTITTLIAQPDGTYTTTSNRADTGAPTAITTSSTGQIYIANTASDTVTVIDPIGTTTTLTVGNDPEGLAIGPNGTLYTANATDNTLTTTNVLSGATQSIAVSMDPSTVSVGTNGDLLITSNFDRTLTVLPRSTTPGPSYTSTAWPTATGAPIAVGPDGSVYVGQSWVFGDNVYEYDPTGTTSHLVTSFNDFDGGIDKLIVDSKGNVFALTSTGLSVYDNGTSSNKWLAPTENYGVPISATIANMALGADGNLYATASSYLERHSDGTFTTLTNQILIIHPDDGYSVTTVPVSLDLGSGYNIARNTSALAVDSNGLVYVTNGTSTVDVVDPHTMTDSTIDVGRSTSAHSVAVDANGHVYIGTGDNTVTVLNPDQSIDAVIPVGIDSQLLTVGPDDNLYIANYGSNSVAIVDLDSYSVSSAAITSSVGQADGVQWLESGSSGVYAQAYIAGTSAYQVNKIAVYVPPPPALPPPPAPPAPVDPTVPYLAGPTGAYDLYTTLRQTMDGKTPSDGSYTALSHGVSTQQVLVNGKEALIVYIAGTIPASLQNQSLLKNVPSFFGTVDQQQINVINTALAGSDEPILLVGYSQGGMDAQNIASERYFKDQIKAVITYGSPIIQTDTYPTVHLEDPLDPISKLSAPYLLTALKSVVTFFGNRSVYEAATPNDLDPRYVAPPLLVGIIPGLQGDFQGVLGIHTDESTYQDVGTDFDGDTSSTWDSLKTAMSSYFTGGQIVPTGYTVINGTIATNGTPDPTTQF